MSTDRRHVYRRTRHEYGCGGAMYLEPLRVGSVCTGIGGIDLACERAGMQTVWQIEIDKFCNKVLEHHWPGVKRYVDLTQVDAGKLEPIDVLAGGTPCQDLSVAGKRAGLAGSRSSLFFDFA